MIWLGAKIAGRIKSRGRLIAGPGFTLVELVAVLVLLGLLLGLAVPGFQRSWEREKLRTGLRQLLLELKKARAQAVARNTTVKVFFDLEQNTLQWGDGSPQRSPVVINGRESALVWQEPTHRQGCLVFYSDGSSSGGYLTLIGPGFRKWLLTVDQITGKIELKDVAARKPSS